MTAGQLLSEARHRHGVSQKRLAIRAGTTQSAISRIERERASPTFETLQGLLRLLGEDLLVSSEARDAGIDGSLIDERLRLTPTQRLDYGLAFVDQVIQMSPNVRQEDRHDDG
jgi:transcriptional regulator with XRE-family HTH domain